MKWIIWIPFSLVVLLLLGGLFPDGGAGGCRFVTLALEVRSATWFNSVTFTPLKMVTALGAECAHEMSGGRGFDSDGPLLR